MYDDSVLQDRKFCKWYRSGEERRAHDFSEVPHSIPFSGRLSKIIKQEKILRYEILAK